MGLVGVKTQYLILMVGIPGSGKSTIAKEILDGKNDCFPELNSNNTKLLSSDIIRKELLGSEGDQSNNQLVFQTLKDRLVKYVKLGFGVIVDATNINMKERKGYLELIRKYNLTRKIAYVVNTPYDECVRNAEQRTERPLPDSVLFKVMCRFQCPQEYEGLEVIFHRNQLSLKDTLNSYSVTPSYIEAVRGEIYENMYSHMKVSQDNPHHKYDIDTHCYKTMQALGIDNYDMYIAARLHDIGKIFTRTYDENGVAHYYNHDNVGAYYVCSHIPEIFFDEDKSHILFTIFLINYHMLPFSFVDNGSKNVNNSVDNFSNQKEGKIEENQMHKTLHKYAKIFGEAWLRKLLILHKADKESC